ncbi:MarR family winged helix-turn-helix transcriptional regulator [Tessaracoccus antarcticus]|uniref:MarR family transcriptional regulator n=1 Tax=Tessaracoccus antarcticus TaxID=2479848 RepID=A0A3M0GB04_9ACTN|nr:MarR family winged helix-turn-helix transcriptional regulator [Tessaracoccus antarcticus]RMB62151.1 MarR family transcriptional regulator [Tessaracoccus antarcticus]
MPHDEVDQVVEAWRSQRPDLAVDSMHVWSRIHRLSALLDTHRKQCFSDRGLEAWEFDVLAALRRVGEPHRLSPGRLLAETHVTSGTMTHRIDRLRARGLVTRLRNPQDGRGALVELTVAGRELVDDAIGALIALEESLLGEWSPGDREALADLLRRLLTDAVAKEPARA